jgi:hypothetical protein
MTAPTTEHFSGPVDHSGLPADISHDERFIDPEAAVDDALRATHDEAPVDIEQPQAYEGVRTLGKHMLGLLEHDDSSERERLGARIILMNGTSTERKLLFLHDAVDVSRQVAEGGGLAEMIREWDVPQSLVELGDAPGAVRDLMRKAQRGEAVTKSEFDKAVLESFTEIVPHLPAQECVGYLQAARNADGALNLGELRDAKLLRELEAKIPEVDDPVSQAVIAETVLEGAASLQTANYSQVDKHSGELVREAEEVSGRLLGSLDPRLRSVCGNPYTAVFNRHNLAKVIDAADKGVTFKTYETLHSVDNDFGRQVEGITDPAALNRMAAFAGEQDSERRKHVQEELLLKVPAGAEIEALKLADGVVEDKEFGLEPSHIGQVGTVVSLLHGRDPEAQAKMSGDLKDLGRQVDLAPALQIYGSKEDLQQLLDTAARGDEIALRDLQGVLQSPAMVDMIKNGEVTFYAGGDVDIKTLFVDEGYTANPTQMAKRAFLGELGSDPRAAVLADSEVARPVLARWISITMNTNNYATREQCEASFGTMASKWERALNENPLFWQFISAQGPGYTLREQLMDVLVMSDKPDVVATNMSTVFMGNHPLWLVNLEIAKWAIEGEAYHKGMVVDEIPVGLPVSDRLNDETLHEVLSGSLLQSIKDMSVEEKRMWLDVDGLDDDAVSAIESIEFERLREDTRETALGYRLFETIETSRSERMRQQASERNADFAYSGADVWEPGMLTHFTQPEGARIGLINGNLAGEIIGIGGGADSYPYNVDFVVANEEVLSGNSHRERLDMLGSSAWGPIGLHYRRGPGSFRQGEEFEAPGGFKDQHRLLFGGIPATEISAMTVREPGLVDRLKGDLVNAGLYVPILDYEGGLVFSPDEYRDMRTDRNYDRVKPEVVDRVFAREDSQGGSNEGAEMYLPGPDGKPERWYGKFAQGDDDHLWTEMLTDGLYAGIDPDLVPETKAVIIDGRLARVSKMSDAEGPVTNEGRNRGFIIDAWVGGWDAVFNDDNLHPKGAAVAERIDNGNALDYRARGAKKGTDHTRPFDGVVAELEFGDDNKDLGQGMRQMYPGLTDDNIRAQLARFKERATDGFIDQQVERTRRSRADREFLKRTLKARRDYILTYFADL